MTQEPTEYASTDIQWWKPALFDRTDEQIAIIGDLIEHEDDDALENLFYPEEISKALKREFRRFEMIPIYNYYAECLGSDNVFIVRDKRHAQSALISNYVSGGCRVVQRLDNLRPQTIWRSTIGHLLGGTMADGLYCFDKDLNPALVHTMDVYDYVFWISEFSFHGSGPLERKFKHFVESVFASAPAGSALFNAAENAEEWLSKAGMS